MERVLGKIESQKPGPLVICVAGIHGNEQVGIDAFNNVFTAIESSEMPFRGKLVGLMGNLKAIASDRRFVDYDMNRAWTDANFKRIQENKEQHLAEDEEVIALQKAITEESEGEYTQLIIVDLHATSSDKGNFVILEEKSAGHPVIEALRIPTIIGLNRYLKGTLLEYYHNRGFLAFAFEGGMVGQHHGDKLHIAGIWEILRTSGCISQHDHAEENHYMLHLEEIAASLPRQVFVKHHQKVAPDEKFQMLPGFQNFQQVLRGELLATNKEGHIRSPCDGLIFMPLYQNEGEDGFFIATLEK